MEQTGWIEWLTDRDAWLWTGALLLAVVAVAAVVAVVTITRR